MISSQFHVNIQVCERVFVHTLWSHCPPLNALRSLALYSAPTSICIPLSEAAQRKGDLQFTSHKSPQIFRSFYQQMVWLSVCTSSLHPCTLNLDSCSSRGNPVLMFASQSAFTYQLRCCKFKWLWTMPDMENIYQLGFGGRLNFWFFLRNCYLLGTVKWGQSVVLLNTCIRQVKRSIRRWCSCHDDTFMCFQVNNKENEWHILRVVCVSSSAVTHRCFCSRCPLWNAAASGCVLACVYALLPLVESVRSDRGGPTCHRCAYHQPRVGMRLYTAPPSSRARELCYHPITTNRVRDDDKLVCFGSQASE